MKHIFCTLAVGDEYKSSALALANDTVSKSDDHIWVIATDESKQGDDRIIEHPLLENHIIRTPSIADHLNFNYNLKYYPLQLASQYNEYDYIIYIDSDWRLVDGGYEPEKITNLLNWFKDSEYDFLFERPHSIGAGKHDGSNCFWAHKRKAYELLETDKYDHGHVCNEQFMVFKNNDKFKKFTGAWEERYWFAVKNNVWQFAEGVEVGMSYIDAEMNSTWRWPTDKISNCFEFNSNAGLRYTRF